MEEGAVLIAVFPERASAERAADAARRAGVPAADVHIGGETERVASLRAEMHDEVENAFIMPQVGVSTTKEMTKGIAVVVPLFGLIGAVLALPLAALEMGSLAVWARLLIVAGIGAAGGATVGAIVGAGLSARGPEEPSAADRGVVVRINADSPELEAALAELEPVRLDVVSPDGTPLRTVTTEDENDDEGIFEHLKNRLTQPVGGDWSRVSVHETERLADAQRAQSSRAGSRRNRS